MSSFRLRTFVVMLVFFVALGVRWAVVERMPLQGLTEDSEYYERQARQLRAGGWEVYFPNGYPLLLAALPGELGSVPHRQLALRANVVLSAAVCALVVLAVVQLGAGVVLAGGAGLLCALWPNQINYTRQVMSEPLTAFLVTSAMAGLAGRRWGLAGLCWGLACTVRSSLLPAAVLFVVWRLWRGDRTGMGRCVAGLALPVLLFIAVGGVRGNRAGLDGAFLHNVVHSLATTGEPLQRHPDNALYLSPPRTILTAYATAAVQDPLHFLHQRAAAIWAMWGPWPGDSNYGRSAAFRAMIGVRALLLLAGLWGAWQLRREPVAIAGVALVAGLTLLHMMLYATSRHSYPVEPVLMILAAGGAAAWSRRRTIAA
jgi:hypothetical protein